MKHQGTNLLERYPMLRDCGQQLDAALGLLVATFERGNKLLLCGNGGSAADCEHFAGELMKGFLKTRTLPASAPVRGALARSEKGQSIAAKLQGALAAIPLPSHTSLCSAVANDVDADMVFAQQVYGFGKAGDVLMAISTSGNSPNVVNALVTAAAMELGTILLTGRSGGDARSVADVVIAVPADTVVEIQELHLPVYHWLAVELEQRFFPG